MPAYAATTGLNAATKSIEVSSHNIANAKTVGYKRQMPVFSDLAYKNSRRVGETEDELGIMQIGSGVALVNITSNLSQGDLSAVEGQPLTMAINGEGFFVVTRPDGTLAYTRNGVFEKNSEGVMSAQGSGYQFGQDEIVFGENATEITIKERGEVTAKIDGEIEVLGQVQLATFANPSGLKRIGNNLYEATIASGEPVYYNPGDGGSGMLKHGFIEQSNANPIEEILDLTQNSHLYNYNLKAFEIANEAEKRLVDTRI